MFNATKGLLEPEATGLSSFQKSLNVRGNKLSC